MTNAVNVLEGLKSDLKTLSILDGTNGRTMTVRGWPMALIRNGGTAWDILSPEGLQTIEEENLAYAIGQIVLSLEAENAGWDFDPEDIAI